MTNPDTDGPDVGAIYRDRFAGEDERRRQLWGVLCEHWFQRYADPDATVLEVAAGHCEFINSIRAKRKIAVDINGDTGAYADADVEVHITSATSMPAIPAETVDLVFISNLFEHLTWGHIMATLRDCHRVLRPGKRLVVLQPNIHYCHRDYWMFCDHITPVDDRALAEALRSTGFHNVKVYPRFLPYTTKCSLPSAPVLVKAYLKCPLAWRFLGGQALVIAER